MGIITTVIYTTGAGYLWKNVATQFGYIYLEIDV